MRETLLSGNGGPPPNDGREALGDSREVARHLKVAPGVLANWRAAGTGPPFIRLAGQSGGRAIRYRWSDVDSWLEANTVHAPSE